MRIERNKTEEVEKDNKSTTKKSSSIGLFETDARDQSDFMGRTELNGKRERIKPSGGVVD